MDPADRTTIETICNDHDNDRVRLLDICRHVQRTFGRVSRDAITLIAKRLDVHRIEVESVVTFYAFLSPGQQRKGKTVIRLCDDVIDRMCGYDEVEDAFERALGIVIGGTTADGTFSLERTACIGMSDQAPAALVNDTVVTDLTPEKAKEIVRQLRANPDPDQLSTGVGDGNNAHPLVKASVHNNIRQRGGVLLSDWTPGAGLERTVEIPPEAVIGIVKESGLRGRGGAGFPTGLKWKFAREADGQDKYIICNADEGEPGTFKDRVLLTERAQMLLEGMAIAGYAVGATKGILYLRAEYAYLYRYIQHIIETERDEGRLGVSILGKAGFDFDVRVQLGAGAYICGEETALITSAEGGRGDPKNRPPFPVQRGFLDHPTVVNNVETLCGAARILEKGSRWFQRFGNPSSPGTKLLSVSGDCRYPGVYEVDYGTCLSEVLRLVGATDAQAVQIGGPSGRMVNGSEFGGGISCDELATGGSLMVFGPGRDLLEIVSQFMEFFVDESCGYCTPCRVGNVLLKQRIDQIRRGRGQVGDAEYMEEIGKVMKAASRCGLGQTSANPVISSLKNFPKLYHDKLHWQQDGVQIGFDLAAAVAESELITGRKSIHVDKQEEAS